MNVKLDTKEKFTVITLNEPEISAIMTDKIDKLMLSYLDKDIPHVILNMKHVINVDESVAEKIAGLQQQFYANSASFIVCALQNNVQTLLNDKDLLEMMNVTPTESEAWDILQMEEVERELLKDFDEEDLK